VQATYARCAEAAKRAGALGHNLCSSLSKATFAFGYASTGTRRGNRGGTSSKCISTAEGTRGPLQGRYGHNLCSSLSQARGATFAFGVCNAQAKGGATVQASFPWPLGIGRATATFACGVCYAQATGEPCLGSASAGTTFALAYKRQPLLLATCAFDLRNATYARCA
jgi:hypothetical protein